MRKLDDGEEAQCFNVRRPTTSSTARHATRAGTRPRHVTCREAGLLDAARMRGRFVAIKRKELSISQSLTPSLGGVRISTMSRCDAALPTLPRGHRGTWKACAVAPGGGWPKRRSHIAFDGGGETPPRSYAIAPSPTKRRLGGETGFSSCRGSAFRQK